MRLQRWRRCGLPDAVLRALGGRFLAPHPGRGPDVRNKLPVAHKLRSLGGSFRVRFSKVRRLAEDRHLAMRVWQAIVSQLARWQLAARKQSTSDTAFVHGLGRRAFRRGGKHRTIQARLGPTLQDLRGVRELSSRGPRALVGPSAGRSKQAFPAGRREGNRNKSSGSDLFAGRSAVLFDDFNVLFDKLRG